MRTPYLKQNGNAWLYQRAVPKEFVSLVGKATWTVGLGAIDKAKAVARVRELATQHDALIVQLKRVGDEIRRQGGREGLARMAANAEIRARFLERASVELLGAGQEIELEAPEDEAALCIGLGTQAARTASQARKEAKDARELASHLDKPQGPPRRSWKALFDLWVRVRQPKITRKHADTVKLLEECLPGADYTKVTPRDIGKFRDWMATRLTGRSSQAKHLDQARALFGAAQSRFEIATNPAAGIKIDGKPPKSKRQSFTGPQLKKMLELAAEVKWGGEHHEAVMWALRLLIWTGARVNEIAQLRKVDVYTEGGVPLIHIREGHPEQSVKTGEDRKVPLHPAVAGFVEWAAAQPNEFVFPFKLHPTNKRGDWLIRNFPRFRRSVCRITEKGLVLHSIRHHFHDALDNADVPDKAARVLVGHAARDIHQRYGQGPGLRKLADFIARTDVLGE